MENIMKLTLDLILQVEEQREFMEDSLSKMATEIWNMRTDCNNLYQININSVDFESVELHHFGKCYDGTMNPKAFPFDTPMIIVDLSDDYSSHYTISFPQSYLENDCDWRELESQRIELIIKQRWELERQNRIDSEKLKEAEERAQLALLKAKYE